MYGSRLFTVYFIILQTLHKTLKEKRKDLRDLAKSVQVNKQENIEMDRNLRELEVSVAERTILEDLAGEKM